uniref:Uncharacterized protein n=1 Tax=Heterorhabditis bacteriophora TaxID=37862 RepID=A0A1I7W7M0_HETBA
MASLHNKSYILHVSFSALLRNTAYIEGGPYGGEVLVLLPPSTVTSLLTLLKQC